MTEIWRAIQGYEGKYKVSNLGRVLSCYTNKILQEYIEDGHCYVRFYSGNTHKDFAVHRLVAQHFIPFIPEHDMEYEVHHIDEVAWHNYVGNLQIMTIDAHRTYHCNEQSKNTNSWKKVKCIETGEVFKSAGDAYRSMTKLHTKTKKNVVKGIKRCCTGENQTAYGYHWEYV